MSTICPTIPSSTWHSYALRIAVYLSLLSASFPYAAQAATGKDSNMQREDYTYYTLIRPKERPKKCIVVLTGSLNPPHPGHIMPLIMAIGYQIQQGVLPTNTQIIWYPNWEGTNYIKNKALQRAYTQVKDKEGIPRPVMKNRDRVALGNQLLEELKKQHPKLFKEVKCYFSPDLAREEEMKLEMSSSLYCIDVKPWCKELRRDQTTFILPVVGEDYGGNGVESAINILEGHREGCLVLYRQTDNNLASTQVMQGDFRALPENYQRELCSILKRGYNFTLQANQECMKGLAAEQQTAAGQCDGAKGGINLSLIYGPPPDPAQQQQGTTTQPPHNRSNRGEEQFSLASYSCGLQLASSNRSCYRCAQQESRKQEQKTTCPRSKKKKSYNKSLILTMHMDLAVILKQR